jgi:hypothetical protein
VDCNTPACDPLCFVPMHAGVVGSVWLFDPGTILFQARQTQVRAAAIRDGDADVM